MSDLVFLGICLLIGLVIALLKFGPTRSDLWGAGENWCRDNRIVNRTRERRRADRKAMRERKAEREALAEEMARLEVGR